MIDMIDYKKLYHKMMNASEDAINLMEDAVKILIAAQRECEEQVISEGDNPPGGNLTVLPRHEDKE